MKRKRNFINEIETLLAESSHGLTEESLQYWEEFKVATPLTPDITENGMKIITFMYENMESYINVFQARNIGEGLGVSGRSISGSMKKLVSDGFVKKISEKPVAYAITEMGIQRIKA